MKIVNIICLLFVTEIQGQNLRRGSVESPAGRTIEPVANEGGTDAGFTSPRATPGTSFNLNHGMIVEEGKTFGNSNTFMFGGKEAKPGTLGVPGWPSMSTTEEKSGKKLQQLSAKWENTEESPPTTEGSHIMMAEIESQETYREAPGKSAPSGADLVTATGGMPVEAVEIRPTIDPAPKETSEESSEGDDSLPNYSTPESLPNRRPTTLGSSPTNLQRETHYGGTLPVTSGVLQGIQMEETSLSFPHSGRIGDNDPEDDVCSLPAVTGPCRGHVEHYYYSVDSQTCELFIYGGCEGNGNNFATADVCEAVCGANREILSEPAPIKSEKDAEPEPGLTVKGISVEMSEGSQVDDGYDNSQLSSVPLRNYPRPGSLPNRRPNANQNRGFN